MATSEHDMNTALGLRLGGMRCGWIVQSQPLGSIRGSAAQPDVLVTELGGAPLVIESEVHPARTVEVDAKSRLGKMLSVGGRSVETAIALRTPARFRGVAPGPELEDEWTRAWDLEFCVFTGRHEGTATRFPVSGWIDGSLRELAVATHLASLQALEVEGLVELLENGVSDAANRLDSPISARQRPQRIVSPPRSIKWTITAAALVGWQRQSSPMLSFSSMRWEDTLFRERRDRSLFVIPISLGGNPLRAVLLRVTF